MKYLNIVFILIVAIVIGEARCGVIGSVYGEISNKTQAVKDDVYSWWSYGVDTVMGSVDENKDLITDNVDNVIDKTKTEAKQECGIISGIYNKVKGGVSYGYMKVHDAVLGKDSDPNKGIIRTLFERAMHRLSKIKAYVIGDNIGISQREAQENTEEREKVLKVLFGDNTQLFNSESEKRALDSLRRKLTEAGDHTIHLLDDEREVIKKAYEHVHNKADEIKTGANNLAVNMKNEAQQDIDTTQEFIKYASKKVCEGAQNFGENVQKSVNDMKLQSVDDREKVLKILFGNNTPLFNSGSEKQALDSLRRKLTEAGDHTIHLLDDEREVIKKAYEHVHNKADEVKTGANNLAVDMKSEAQQGIDTTQEFIKDASNKVSEGAQNFGENVQRSVNDIKYKLQS